MNLFITSSLFKRQINTKSGLIQYLTLIFIVLILCLVCVPHSVPSMGRVTIILLLVSVVSIHSNPLQVLDNILRRYSRITLVLPTLKKANTNFMLYLVRTGFSKIELLTCKNLTISPRQIQETNEKHISKNRFKYLVVHLQIY